MPSRLLQLSSSCLCVILVSQIPVAQSSQLNFAPAVPYASGGYYALSVAVADVNGDGKPDIVVANYCEDSSCANGGVDVLLGNGDGTFQSAVKYGSGGVVATSVAVADVNGDGKPDLLVTNGCASSTDCSNGNVSVLLGNDDGTFQPAVTYGSGGDLPLSVAVADVNGDGQADLLVANSCPNFCGLAVLLGNGDGTFQPAVTVGFVVYAFSVAVGDVNGDGKPDVAVASNGEFTPEAVFLNNGDGTFEELFYESTGYGAMSIAVADVNGDGKPDLLVANQCANATECENGGDVAVLLGNGDGTFQSAVKYGSGGVVATSVAVADVNGDGKPDLLVANWCASSTDCSNGNVSVLPGNGDGTFQPAVKYGTSGADARSVAVADVNGDGKPDIVVANECADSNCANGGVGVLINLTPSPYNAFVQQPINADGSSIFKANRRVIPVKFSLTKNNTPTCDLPSATISVTRTAGGTLGTIDENTYLMSADNGSNFRIDTTGCQYIYNLAASRLGPGIYQINIRVYGFVVGNAVFALR